MGVDNRFTWPDEEFDQLFICIDQMGLLALVTRVQANDKLDLLKIEHLGQLFIGKPLTQHQGTITWRLFDFMEIAKVFLVAGSTLLSNGFQWVHPKRERQ